MLEALQLPTSLPTAAGVFTLRRAATGDVADIMRLLADDPISAAHSDTGDPADEPAYRTALARIIADPMNDAVLVVDGAQPVGMVHVTVVPGLAWRGTVRLVVEGVRVASDRRSTGIGTALLRWVLDVAAPAAGATRVQVASGVARTDAHRFYGRLGFAASHVGLTYVLASDARA